MRKWIIKILPALAFVAVFLLIVDYAKQNSPNRDDAQLKELEQIASSVPTFSDFRSVGMQTSSRAMDAGIYKYYRSSASYTEIKDFYTAELSQRGWFLVEDSRSLEFRKDDYLIAVEYAGNISKSSDWNFAVSFVWRNK